MDVSQGKRSRTDLRWLGIVSAVLQTSGNWNHGMGNAVRNFGSDDLVLLLVVPRYPRDLVPTSRVPLGSATQYGSILSKYRFDHSSSSHGCDEYSYVGRDLWLLPPLSPFDTDKMPATE